MSQPSYLEILKRRNPGVYIEERDFSEYNVTQFFNKFTLVVGVSKKGPVNLPILVISPENFEEIFGTQDLALERRGSYFHRTVKDMLKESPVICVNLRLNDSIEDKYNWLSLSVSSTNFNSLTRSNPVIDFFDVSNGFWKRSSEQLNNISKNNLPDSDNKPLTVVNQSDKPVSLLFFKSDVQGFDITVEDWFGYDKFPTYLNNKDYISDYMVQVVAIEGDWSNYRQLSVDPKWSKYFNKDGINKDTLDEFYNQETVNLIKRWQTSLIPYLVDKQGNDLFIESVVNDDINETGILISYDVDSVEQDFRSGKLDILGDNLTNSLETNIDYLSYKKYLTDFLVIDENLLDVVGNSFGNHIFNSLGRTFVEAEGYVHNVKLKPIIISSTTSVLVKPFDASNNAYGIINGKKIDIDSDISEVLALHETVSYGNHIAFLVLLTSDGIEFRLGEENSLDEELYLPHIDGSKEIVLGYYELGQDLMSNYYADFYPICVDENGFVNPFRTINDNIEDYKISFNQTNESWIQELYFEKIYSLNPQNYKQQRIYHLWYWLSENLLENVSLAIDSNENKQLIDWIEQKNDKDGRIIRFATKDKTSDIKIQGTNGIVGLYIKDSEFLEQNDYWRQSLPPLAFSTSGIIGYESVIKESYIKGEINSGDPFFWSIEEEYDTEFIYDNNSKQNMILLSEESFTNYNNQKIIVENSENNDGIFTILNSITINNRTALIVKENVISEYNDHIKIYDAENPYIINLYTINNETFAQVDIWSGDPEELYKRLKNKDDNAIWAKTLEIEKLVESNKIIVDWERYVDKIEVGKFLLANNEISDLEDINEKKKNWTRIIDVRKISDTELLIETDNDILLRSYENDLQTDYLIDIPTWTKTLDFKVLKPFIPRKEVFPDGTESKLQEILSLIDKNTKLHKSLAHEKMEWRYLVDSFGLGNYPNSKIQLSDLSESKIFAMSFINCPSVKAMRKDGTKYSTKGYFDTTKFVSGGDKKYNTGDFFSMPNTSYGAYLMPYVSVYENSRYYNVPPSSHIAQMFMRKHNDKKVKIHSPLAGIMNSKITTISGVEEKFSEDELTDLNNYGITTINNFDNITFYINNERLPLVENSVLQYIHNREAVIELETRLHDELLQYQWEVIDKSLEDSIKERIENTANNICLFYKKNGAISDFTNKFSATNEQIDAQLGVLETRIELDSVMQTILLRVSIAKTGDIKKI